MFKKTIVSLSLFFVIAIMNACSSLGTLQVKDTPPQRADIKSFDAEDAYILFALRAEELRDNRAAYELFQVLYEKSGKKEYLYKALKNQIVLKKNQEVIDTVNEVTSGSLDDFKLLRLKIIALYELKEYNEAESVALLLVEKSQYNVDYLLLSNIYIQQKKYKLALKYLQSAYVKNYDEKILDKIAIIMFVNLHRKKDAITQLESHSRIKGCSKLICNRLIGFYKNEKNIDGVLSTYIRMYENHQDDAIAKKIIQIYNYKKEYHKMMLFLEKYPVDEETLLEIYVATKDYKKAFVLANRLYESSGDVMYLGQSAIFEYESIEKNDDKKVLQSVVKKLEEVVQKDKDPVYENYLGYVLIDHEIDIKKGMQHIENVLVAKPNSAYYLDSLAWGYYKLHQCFKAKTIMDKVVTLEGGDDPEVIEHVQSINRCIQTKKGKK